uniref:N-acetylneuraminate lyase n=1 Tax=Calcidiscus leptoporus TaxID=127549 RepID=A0A7S0IVN9_9EUKA|mmetsp:Transcript_24732/g.57612  ORF Transcript_24732/g.57612 Transcript_24732/m.57612 type:complete len:342 (+) Transcript_24732:60-1085(+)
MSRLLPSAVQQAEMNPSPLRVDGLVAAVYSPFASDGTLNLTVVPLQHRYLAQTGVEWAFVGGTTGESLSLTVAERKSLLEAWANTSTRLIAHCGAEALGDARELAAHAAAVGVAAVAAMPPTFFKPASADALALTIASICSAAPSKPCYYYHIPSMTGVATTFTMLDFVRAIEPRSPNFAGIKYTGMYTYPGMMDAEKVLNYREGKFEVFSGREEMMLQALSIGIKGHVGSQFNFAGDLYNRLRTGFARSGLTPATETRLRGLQALAVQLVDAWHDNSPTGVNGAKYLMNLAGVPVGDARLPSLPVASAAAKLRAARDHFCRGTAASQELMLCARGAWHVS